MVKPEFPCQEQRSWCFKIFVSVCVFFTGTTSILISYVVANDRKATESSAELRDKFDEHRINSQREYSVMLDIIRKDMNSSFYEVVQRLSRIEAKVGG